MGRLDNASETGTQPTAASISKRFYLFSEQLPTP
jgi:hypothetical protein